MKKFITAFYIFMVCAAATTIFLLGTFVAPTIFHTEKIHGVALMSRYDAGLVMTRIFEKANYIFMLTMATMAFYDGMLIAKKKTNMLIVSLSSISIISMATHVFFFIPKIIEFQIAGEYATKSESFAAIHKLSETNFKVALFCLMSLVLIKMTSSLKDNCCGGSDD